MRTNIELDDDLVREARKFSRATTKKGLIEEALTSFIAFEKERRRRESYRERLQHLQVKLSGVALRDRPAKLLREDRSR